MHLILKKYSWEKYAHGDISCCMISKNEEKYLQRCYNSIKNLCSEIILVDTGSDDNTVKIAKELGIKVYHYNWEDDFSAPRNYSLSKATKDWILVMDPDEVISIKDHFQIKQYTIQSKILAFQIPTRNYSLNLHQPGFQFSKGEYLEEKGFYGYTPSIKTRLFKNNLGIIFKGCWHELVDYYIYEHKIPCRLVKTPIHHWTHEIGNKSLQEKKDFYLKLGEKKVLQDPKDYQAWWELGVAESIYNLRHRAAYSMAQSFKSGYIDTQRLFSYSRVLRYAGYYKSSRHTFEKAICLLYPSLTHIRPDLKTSKYLVDYNGLQQS